jgi:pimeloyl-ACP methyl ester carboxylesterase
VSGDGPLALVFVHGVPGDRSEWDAVSAPFRDGHVVVALDLAGHGDSGTPATAATPGRWGGDVLAVVDRLGLDRVILIGRGAGAEAAYAAAQSSPERVLGVVALEPAPAAPDGVATLRVAADLDDSGALRARLAEAVEELTGLGTP